jgi:hypothetical protein
MREDGSERDGRAERAFEQPRMVWVDLTPFSFVAMLFAMRRLRCIMQSSSGCRRKMWSSATRQSTEEVDSSSPFLPIRFGSPACNRIIYSIPYISW